MPRGGARPGSGPKKGTKYRPRKPKADKAVEKSLKTAKKQKPKPETKTDRPKEPENTKQEPSTELKPIEFKEGYITPLQYMLDVMNDETQEDQRRAWAAQCAAPYIHQRASEKGTKKKERDERAKKAGSGRFAPAAPPKLKAVK